jgi:acetoin utilization protein AcuB
MARDPVTVPPDARILSALAIMRNWGVRHLLVVEDDRLVGVLSNRDYRKVLERVGPDGTIRGVHDVTVAEIMTPGEQVITAAPETPLREVAALVVSRGIGCLPLVDPAGRPVGILSQKDVLAGLLRED